MTQYYYRGLLVTCYSWEEYQKLKKQKYERSTEQIGQPDQNKTILERRRQDNKPFNT